MLLLHWFVSILILTRNRSDSSDNIEESYPAQSSSLAPGRDRRVETILPRRIRSVSEVDSKNPESRVSYIEFIRRATSTHEKSDWENPRDHGMTDSRSDCDSALRHNSRVCDTGFRPGSANGK